MADPVIHAPGSDSDAISFGEMSDYDSYDEDSSLPKKPSETRHDDEPSLENDGFEFSSADQGMPNMEDDGFEFIDADSAFPNAQYFNAEQGSVHTMPDYDEQPRAEHAPFESPRSQPRKQRQKEERGALGVLYCGTCDKYFGNEKVFKRHFMFGIKHGEEPRDMRELYYKIWGQTWADEARELGRVSEVDDMEL